MVTRAGPSQFNLQLLWSPIRVQHTINLRVWLQGHSLYHLITVSLDNHFDLLHSIHSLLSSLPSLPCFSLSDSPVHLHPEVLSFSLRLNHTQIQRFYNLPLLFHCTVHALPFTHPFLLAPCFLPSFSICSTLTPCPHPSLSLCLQLPFVLLCLKRCFQLLIPLLLSSLCDALSCSLSS